MLEATDITSRPPVSPSIKDAISNAFLEVPEGKNSAALAIWDFDKKAARLHFAWKTGDVWKVGAQIGWSKETKVTGYVGVEAVW